MPAPITTLLILLLGLLLTACGSVGNTAVPSSTPTMAALAMVETPAVFPSATQTALLMPTNTPSPVVVPTRTSTPRIWPTPQPGCNGAPLTRLVIGQRGRVTENDQSLNLRSGPGTENGILLQIPPGELFIVVDGIRCAGGFTWYQVRYDGRTGWLAEGETDEYYAEPYPPG